MSATLSPRATPKAGEHVGQPIGFALQIPERMRGSRARFVLPVERETRAVGRPAAAACRRDVEFGGNVPAVAGVNFRVMVGGHGPANLLVRGGRGNLRSGRPYCGLAPKRHRAGSTVAHTQSVCCSSKRPNRIGLTPWTSSVSAVWWAGTRRPARSTIGRPNPPSRFRSVRKRPWKVRPLIVVVSPSTE